MWNLIQSCSSYVPLTFGALFIGGLFGYRVMRHSRTYGKSPIHLPGPCDYSAHALLSRLLVLFFTLVIVLGILAAFWPAALETVDLLYARRTTALLAPGMTLAAVAAWIVWRGQMDMAASWRIGINEAEQMPMVTGGIFRFCRNPIYLGLQLALASFFMMLPGYVTLILLLQGSMLLHVQTRLEEQHLLSLHQTAYRAYCAAVGRFLPFSGRWHKFPDSPGAQ